MEADVPDGGSDRRLNRLVAITVVILSVFMGVSKVKDDNIVQAMQQAKADAVDRWSEYQAVRTKLHIAETARDEIRLIGLGGPATAEAGKEVGRLDRAIAKYRAEAPEVRAAAQGNEARYDALNVHDDQFDASDALISIAISLAAVAALVETPWLLYTAWVIGGLGLVMGMAGFAGWDLHSATLSALLG